LFRLWEPLIEGESILISRISVLKKKAILGPVTLSPLTRQGEIREEVGEKRLNFADNVVFLTPLP